MKTILHLVFIFLFGIVTQAQSPYNPCYEPEWDWTIAENWQVYFPENLLPDGTYLGVTNYPFIETEMNRDFRIILENNDLSPDDGWVLLQKNLGCEIYATAKPYVIFYNYFRGLIRVFALHTYDASSSYGLMTIEWASTNRSSALTYSNIYSRANDKYPSYDNDMAMLQIENYAKDQWWAGEFQVAFDHKTISSQNGYNLNFRIYNVINSELEFTSNVNLVTKSLEIKGEKNKKEGSTVNNTREWAVKNQKAIQKLNYDEWDDYLKKTKEGVLEVYDWSRDQWLENNTFEWLETASAWSYNAVNNKTLGNILTNGAKAIGGVNSALGFMVDFIDFFVGKPSKSSIPNLVQLAPLQITGIINSTGTLKTTTQQYNYTLSLPGTNVNYPYFECPLGVLNLKETPELNVRKWEVSNKKIYSLEKTIIYKENVNDYGTTYVKYHCSQLYDFGNPIYEEETVHWVNSCSGYKSTEKWKSIQLKKDIEISINSASNLELVSAQVAFQGKIQGKSDNNTIPAYNIFEKYQLLPNDINDFRIFRPSNSCSGKCDDGDIGGNSLASGSFISGSSYISTSEKWFNYTFDKLKNKTYFVIGGGEELEGGKRNEFYKFRTEFVDIKEVKNLSFSVREETEVTLKVLAVFKEVNNEDAPLMVFTNEYIINEPENETDATNKPYPFIRNQLTNVDIYQGSNELTIIKPQSITSGTFSNGKVETTGNVSVNTSSNVSFTANHSIVLNPGFSASATGNSTFTAKIVNGANIINAGNTPLNQIAKYFKDGVEYNYPIQCNCIPESSNFKSTKLNSTIDEIENTEAICKVFPNPCSNLLNIDYYTENEGLSQLTIININGKIILQKNIASGFQRIDLSNLQKGVYLMRIFDGESIIIKKIIKN